MSNWGQLSPDGKSILIGTPNFLLYDLESDARLTVLEEGKNPFVKVFSNGTWSPDSKRFCFQGRTSGNQCQIASLVMAQKESDVAIQVHVDLETNSMTDFAWHPQGRRVVLSMRCPERNGLRQLYEFNPDQKNSLKLVAGQDPSRNNSDCCWTADGKSLIVVSGDFCDE